MTFASPAMSAATVAARVDTDMQISADGLLACPSAIRTGFPEGIAYGQIRKVYGHSHEKGPARR